MAIGFTPNNIQIIEANTLSPREFLVLLIESLKKVNWEISHLSRHEIVAYTNQGLFSRNAEIKIAISENSASIKSASIGNEIFDLGMNKKNTTRYITVFKEVSLLFSAEELLKKSEELEINFDIEDENQTTNHPITTSEKISDFLSIFKPVEGYYITPILIILNILIFILMVTKGVSFIAPTTDDLINWGANFRPMTLEGEWWRLFTNCFLHIGVFHLLMNMYALMYIGILLEPQIGRVKFLSAYLLTGLMASVTSLWWHDLTVSAGASGAIFGMYGVFLILLTTTNLIEETARKALFTSIGIFVAYNLLNGLKGGIDNAAHIGGLIAGLVMGYVLTLYMDDEEENKWIEYKIIGSLTVSFLVLTTIISKNLTNDIVIYDQKMRDFYEMEKMALEIYSRANYEPKDALLYNIRDRGIYYWTENINIIDEVDKLQLPDKIHERNTKMKLYCELRIKSFDLLYKTVDEGTNKYKSEIQNYDEQIKSLLSELAPTN